MGKIGAAKRFFVDNANLRSRVIAAAIMVRTSLLWIAVTAALLGFANVLSCLSTAIIFKAIETVISPSVIRETLSETVISMVEDVAKNLMLIDVKHLRRLGIDEISLVKGQGKFIVVIVDIDSGKLIGLGFGLGLFYVGERQGDLNNTFELPSYLRTDAAIFISKDDSESGLISKIC